ncbi:hypothetical protein SDC9_111391 [bioreactor metagenome]|uniref:Uncharacterized protein n=1 Tax=bioreactor metagenome TaxID=1076179 RepID=A0A645BRS0_9ZZZZ
MNKGSNDGFVAKAYLLDNNLGNRNGVYNIRFSRPAPDSVMGSPCKIKSLENYLIFTLVCTSFETRHSEYLKLLVYYCIILICEHIA